MEKYLTSSINFTDLLTGLKSNQLITDEKEKQIGDFLNSEEQEGFSPWYIYAMVGAAAWFSALFLLVFLFRLNIIGEKQSSIAGVALCVVAIVLRKEYAKSIFLDQLSLAANVAGQFLVIFGYNELFGRGNGILGICLSIIVLQVIMSFLYHHPLQHFAAPHVVSYSTFAYFISVESVSICHFLIIALAGFSIVCFTKESFLSKWKCYKPLTLGVVTAFLLSVYSSIVEDFKLVSMNWWITTSFLSVLLLYVEYTIFKQYKIALDSSRAIFIIGTTVLFCLVSYNSPGLIAALLIIILAFSRGDYMLTSLAFASFASFLFFYYYSLNLSLLQKSWALMGTGTILLLFRVYYVKNFTEVIDEK